MNERKGDYIFGRQMGRVGDGPWRVGSLLLLPVLVSQRHNFSVLLPHGCLQNRWKQHIELPGTVSG
jgi:hypothetical protein